MTADVKVQCLSQILMSKSAIYMYLKVSTAELQWLEHLWNIENMVETGVVQTNEFYSKRKVMRHYRDIFSIFFKLKVYCVFSLESSHRGDSNEYT